jgi:hypothetical protein
VAAYQAVREARLDAVLTQSFDHQAQSTRIEPGTPVAYSKAFLKAIGCECTDPMWFACGTVTSIKPLGPDIQLASVLWWNGEHPEKVNVKNLAKVGPNLHFADELNNYERTPQKKKKGRKKP